MRLPVRLYLSTSTIALLAFAGGAEAADIGTVKPSFSMATPPAVSALNAKFDVRGGAIDGVWAGFATGSLSLPVGHSFGLQVDGTAGAIGGSFTGAVGGHAFWRDPRYALLGAYGDWGYDARLGGLRVGHAAAEGEAYLGRFTAKGLAGYQFGDVGTGFFGKATLAVYPTDNFKLYAGYVHQPAIVDRGIVGGEAMLTGFKLSGLSLFGEGRIGSGTWSALGGIRLYTGPSKTLIDRHRRDDPGDHFDVFNDAVTGFTPPDDHGCEDNEFWNGSACELIN